MTHTGELSKLFEIDRTTLNYYVKKGLVHPKKGENQYHSYSFSDSMALAYLRHYLGLGFHTEDIPRLFEEGDLSRHLDLIGEHAKRLELENQRLLLKRLLLENLREALSFIRDHPHALLPMYCEPYCFLSKQDIPEDSLWMEIFKMVPTMEFHFSLSDGQQLGLTNLDQASGISLKSSWLESLSLSSPEGALYYPGQEKYVATFSLRGEHLEEDLAGHLSRLAASSPLPFREECVLYLFLTHYEEGAEACFDALCFLTPAGEEE